MTASHKYFIAVGAAMVGHAAAWEHSEGATALTPDLVHERSFAETDEQSILDNPDQIAIVRNMWGEKMMACWAIKKPATDDDITGLEGYISKSLAFVTKLEQGRFMDDESALKYAAASASEVSAEDITPTMFTPTNHIRYRQIVGMVLGHPLPDAYVFKYFSEWDKWTVSASQELAEVCPDALGQRLSTYVRSITSTKRKTDPKYTFTDHEAAILSGYRGIVHIVVKELGCAVNHAVFEVATTGEELMLEAEPKPDTNTSTTQNQPASLTTVTVTAPRKLPTGGDKRTNTNRDDNTATTNSGTLLSLTTARKPPAGLTETGNRNHTDTNDGDGTTVTINGTRTDMHTTDDNDNDTNTVPATVIIPNTDSVSRIRAGNGSIDNDTVPTKFSPTLQR